MIAEPEAEQDALHPNDLSDMCASPNPFKSARICSASEAATYLTYGTVRDFENAVSSEPTIKRGDPDFVMSRSQLFEFANCPRRWKDGYRDGDTPEKDWGSLMDILVLDGEHMNDRVAIEPLEYENSDGDLKPWNNNSKTCRQWAKDNAGKLIVKAKLRHESRIAMKALLDDKHILSLLEASKTQVMFLATYVDEATGIVVPFKGLIDMVPGEPFTDCLADLKTCRSAHPRAWEGHVVSYGYHWQSACYLDAYNKATGETRNEFKHVLQESMRPYYSELTALSYEFLMIGRREYKEALRLYCECLKTNKWPGYRATRIHGCRVTEPPVWMMQKG